MANDAPDSKQYADEVSGDPGPRMPRSLEALEPDDHICGLYSGAAELPTLLAGLTAGGRRAVYFGRTPTCLPGCVQPPLPPGLSLEAFAERLRVAAAMVPAATRLIINFSDLPLALDAASVLACERVIADVVRGRGLVVACLWDQSLAPADLLPLALALHPHLALDAQVHEHPQHLPPETLSEPPALSLLHLYLQSIIERNRRLRHHRLLSSLCDTGGTMTILIDCEGRITRLNRVAEQVSGYRAEDVQGKLVWDLLAQSPDVQQARDRLARLVRSGGSIDGETTVATAGGRQLCLVWTASAIPAEDGTVTSVLISALDMTAPRLAQDALEDATRQYRELVEHANSAILRVDLHGRLAFLNPFAERLFGYSGSEILGRQIEGLLVPDGDNGRGDWREAVTAALRAAPEGRDAEAETVRRDGSRVWVHWTIRALCGQHGEPTGLLVVGSDITDRKLAQRRLQDSERRFRELADMLPDMVYECDSAGRLTYANQTTFARLGYASGDMDGHSIFDMIAEDDLPQAREALARLADEPQRPLEPRRYNLRRADGSLLPVEIHSAPLRDDDGALLGLRGVMRELCRRQELEEAHHLAALGQLAAGVAHEFNNILAAMSGWAELADAGGDDDAQRRLIDTVRQGAGRGAEICRRLIRYARPSEPQCAPLHIEDPLRAALAIADSELQEAGIAVHTNLETGGKRILGDAAQLQQVFLNLIANALHAMHTGGTLTLTTRCLPTAEAAEEVLVLISDTGAGIRPADLPRIFEPFFTTKTLDRSELDGSGLGLSVAQSIVRAHNGTIGATSKLGVGTTFHLHFKAHDEAERPEASLPTEAVVPAPRARHESRVLLAEDDHSIREVLRTALTRRGHQVQAVPSTQEAVSALTEDHYDLVITDLQMPGGGGSELLALSRQLDSPPPVLLITGMIDEKRLQEMLAGGVSACLRKPFSLGELLETADSLIARRTAALRSLARSS